MHCGWSILTQQTQNIYITFVQYKTTVEDVELTLYECYKNVLCLLGTTFFVYICIIEMLFTIIKVVIIEYFIAL